MDKDLYKKVSEFNLQVLGIDPRDHKFCFKDATLSAAQLREEAAEFMTAAAKNDTVGMIDACIDSIYFALGILYKMDISDRDFHIIFDIIHKANMRKVKGKARGRENFESADATKPEDWVSPEREIAQLLGLR